MRKIYSVLSTLIVFLLISGNLFSQNRFFSDEGENRLIQTSGQRVIVPERYRSSTLDVTTIRNFLWGLPSEDAAIANRTAMPVIELPMPNGSMAKFRVWESSIMEPGLSIKFPEIKTFAGQGIDDPYATIRFDYNPYFGFSAQILSPKGRIFIDPYARKDIHNYISYYARDVKSTSRFDCYFEETVEKVLPKIQAGPCLGTQLRTFRLAFSCTGEFAQAVGGGVAGPTHAAIVTGINRVTQVYEDELSVRLLLIANNNLIEYLNPATDPWQNDGSIAELNNITSVINSAIGVGNYDIGHLGCTASNAGVAGLGVVCSASSKGRGLTGGLNPIGDPYYIDYVAHEMGHQFGANHTFNSNQCASPGGSYEPGGGTTIMAYAGICAPSENIQPNSDPIFHAFSFDQIGNFVSTGGGSSCAAVSSNGNTLPIITSTTANNFSIPINTPFVLDANATDANGDAITYNWEGWDVGPAGSWPSAATSTTRPLFRTRVSKTTGTRTFPDIRVIAANYPGTSAPSAMDGLRGEVLPLVARAMKFRLTVRDNRAGGGGVVSIGEGCQDATTFTVNAVGTTAFSVSVPNGGESYPGGTTQTITWNNAGTTASPFNVANVKISLSTDGGLTYPTVILASTPNDGSEAVTIPPITTSNARIRIDAIGNIFFDISNNNFTITPPPNGFSFNSPAPVVASCPAPASMQTTLTATYFGTFTGNISLSASGNPGGTTVTFGTNPLTMATPSTTVTLNGTNTLPAGSYVVTITGTGSGAPTQTRDITFTINPGAGPAITTQPTNQTVCSGANATFSVVATGTYQWQISTDAGASWSPISGATATSYTVTGATPAVSGNQYRCVVSGQCGSTTSNAATLTVNVAPTITAHPQNLALCSGSGATFSVTATGSVLTYQWQLSTDGGTTYNNITGETAASYNIASTTVAMNNNRYRCVVSGACTPSATSNAAVLSVSSSVTITANPVNSTICEATNTSFSVSASGTGLNYQWEVSTDNGATFTSVANGGVYSGATTPTLTITAAIPSLHNNMYRCVVSNPPCNPGISTAARLVVNTFPVINAQPQNVTVCEGTGNTFSVTATTGVGSLSYQWQSSINGGSSYGNIPGATSSTLTLPVTTAAANGYRYRVIVTAGCGSVTSTGAILTVNTYPNISLSGIPGAICKSDAALTFTGSPSGAFSGTGVSGNTFNPSAAGVGAVTVTYTATNAGCTSVKTSVIQVNECADRHRTLDQFPALFVYPSPNTGLFNIRLNTDLYSSLGLRAFNSNGQMVHSQAFSGLTYGSVMSVDMSHVPNGVYHLYIYNNANGFSSKAISIFITR